ncbi:hypothetical protein [Hominifimenecus sp. rT4P-3]|uniref:hypothetical protein n=1 Tax=Hominifimenecus sp. rT4P-3 TaxID=3242979 RepID=UPI003DA2EA0B
MASVNKKTLRFPLLAVAAPAGLSALAAVKRSVWLAAVVAAALFLIVRVVPICKRRENLWMFLLVAAASVPVNLSAVIDFLQAGYGGGDFFFLSLLRGALLYLMLFSIEEIVFGYVTRLLWRRQKKWNVV